MHPVAVMGQGDWLRLPPARVVFVAVPPSEHAIHTWPCSRGPSRCVDRHDLIQNFHPEAFWRLTPNTAEAAMCVLGRSFTLLRWHCNFCTSVRS